MFVRQTAPDALQFRAGWRGWGIDAHNANDKRIDEGLPRFTVEE
jgi:hypothetical protein